MAFNRAKDRQRILQEDPEIISAWFKLVEDTKAKYGVCDNDVHNFNKTGFQMGVIGSMKVVTGAERRARLELVQLGDREWVTVSPGHLTSHVVYPLTNQSTTPCIYPASGTHP
jgi:hypothetical protein